MSEPVSPTFSYLPAVDFFVFVFRDDVVVVVDEDEREADCRQLCEELPAA